MPGLELDRRTLRLMAVAFLLLAALSFHRLFLADAPNEGDVLIVQGQTMGTTYEIRVAGEGLGEPLRRQVSEEAERRLAEIDQWMSNWNPDSEIARFNAHRSVEAFPVSPETAEVVAYSIRMSEWSDGAFDIAVGPLVSRWGFGSHARVDSAPSDSEIETLRARLGRGSIRVEQGETETANSIAKRDPATEIDLSAIAKGYGVDHVAEGLSVLGRTDFLVEIGGEVRASGERPTGGPWRVAIERPRQEGRSIQSILELDDQAMATSGDYRIFYVENGQRISHTIDPRTGRPVDAGPASVTVLAETATEADAWATTLMVLGDPEGLALAEEHGIAALVLSRSEDGAISESANALFPSASAREPAQP